VIVNRRKDVFVGRYRGGSFQSFKLFNRFAPFKTFDTEGGSRFHAYPELVERVQSSTYHLNTFQTFQLASPEF
jgi:hypothetical protein